MNAKTGWMLIGIFAGVLIVGWMFMSFTGFGINFGESISDSNYLGMYKGDYYAVPLAGWSVEQFKSKITSDFGPRTPPMQGASAYHSGVDIGATAGTAVIAAAPGRVYYAGFNEGYGNLVILKHSNSYTRYGHMKDKPGVSKGESVERGQKLGGVGQTGIATGPHLDFGIGGSIEDGIVLGDLQDSLTLERPPLPTEALQQTQVDSLGTSEIPALIEYYSKANGIDPRLIVAIIRRESTFNPIVTSPKGAHGLMQIMPDTAKFIANNKNFKVRFGTIDPNNMYDPETNIKAGTWYLRYLTDKYGLYGLEIVLAAYNDGPGDVDRRIKNYGNDWNSLKKSYVNNEETPAFVADVLTYYADAKQQVPTQNPASLTRDQIAVAIQYCLKNPANCKT